MRCACNEAEYGDKRENDFAVHGELPL